MNNNIGINSDRLNKMILDLYNYCERINKTLDQISAVVEDTKKYYICDTATDFRNKFNSFKTNFPVISKNLKSYADDLVMLKKKYNLIDENMTEQIRKARAKIDGAASINMRISTINTDSVQSANASNKKSWW